MEKEDVIFNGGWIQTEIYAPTYALPHICKGSVYCLPGRRLLDQLNNVFPNSTSEDHEFLPVKKGEICALRGETKTAEFVCLNKTNTLFVRESVDGQTRRSGIDNCRYPYVKKSAIAVKLYIPFYVLTGNMHFAEGQRSSDVLNLSLNFFALTDVEICPAAGNIVSEVSFLAVNKRQVLLLEEV